MSRSWKYHGSKCSVEYTGWVWVDGAKGEQFDSSSNAGRPYKFTLGARMVIPGWDLGLEGLKEGTKANLIIPPTLAYGKRGSGPKIPPDATLIFEVELVQIGGE
jgi:peptidylprolyl isomerase